MTAGVVNTSCLQSHDTAVNRLQCKVHWQRGTQPTGHDALDFKHHDHPLIRS